MPRSVMYIEPAVRIGRVIPNASNVGFLSNVSLYSAEVRVGWQSMGSRRWQRDFNLPEYGVALRYGHFDSDTLGDKVALFGYLNGTLYRIKRWTFHYQFGLGIAYWTKTYDVETNPVNRFIGSHFNAHIDLALGIDCQLSPMTTLTLRGNFSHSSNAAMKLPNMGINPLSGAIGIKCRLKPIAEPLDFSWRHKDTNFVKTNNLFFQVAAGTRQSKKDAVEKNGAAEPYYLGCNLQIGYLRQFHPKFRYGGGFDINYSGELSRHLPEAERATGKYFNVAAFAAFEVLYGRLVVHLSAAAYLYRAFNYYEPFYERAGVRFLLGKGRNHYIGAAVKAHAGSVDYLEWSYGCVIGLKKHGAQ